MFSKTGTRHEVAVRSICRERKNKSWDYNRWPAAVTSITRCSGWSRSQYSVTRTREGLKIRRRMTSRKGWLVPECLVQPFLSAANGQKGPFPLTYENICTWKSLEICPPTPTFELWWRNRVVDLYVLYIVIKNVTAGSSKRAEFKVPPSVAPFWTISAKVPRPTFKPGVFFFFWLLQVCCCTDNHRPAASHHSTSRFTHTHRDRLPSQIWANHRGKIIF